MALYMDVHERQRRLNALRSSHFFGHCTDDELQPLLPLMKLERFVYVQWNACQNKHQVGEPICLVDF
jgi:hypothetical protein